MNEGKVVNLVASALTNSLGTTVIGHVGLTAAQITIAYPDGKTDVISADQNGDFVQKAPADVRTGTITVSAMLPDEIETKEQVAVEIELPAPVITGVISTRNGQRYLEGYVNQSAVEVQIELAGQIIEPVIDEQQNFELRLPDDILPEEVTLFCRSQKTGKTGRNSVSLGVTSKTQPFPILTDDMIAEFQQRNQQYERSQAQLDQTSSQAQAQRQPTKNGGNVITRFFGRLFGRN